jgi:hypothetical protein
MHTSKRTRGFHCATDDDRFAAARFSLFLKIKRTCRKIENVWDISRTDQTTALWMVEILVAPFLALPRSFPLVRRGGSVERLIRPGARWRWLRATPRAVRRGAVAAALVSGVLRVAPASAGPSETSPYVGWGYGQLETPRIAAMGGALRASSISTEAMYLNPANMAAARLYHVGALAMVWPRSSRQTYGVAAVDSIVSSSRLAGGLAGSFSFQDPEGVDREVWEGRGGIAFPFSDAFFTGLSVRYMNATQDGYPRDGSVPDPVAATGLHGAAIGKWVTFDAGMTLKPIEQLAFSVVGYNLTNPDSSFLPLMFSGAAALTTEDFTVELDWVGDFVTYLDTKHRIMAGGEYLFADRVPVRVGYQYDQGADTQSISGGIGYLAREFSVELALRQSFLGQPMTHLFFGFKYHLESAGLTAGY